MSESGRVGGSDRHRHRQARLPAPRRSKFCAENTNQLTHSLTHPPTHSPAKQTPTAKQRHTMFRRALLQQTRQFPRAISAGFPARQWQTAARRSMSTDSSPKPTEDEPPAAAEKPANGNGAAKASGETVRLDALQKELDKKTEEARDFKVPHHPTTTNPPPPPPPHSLTHSPPPPPAASRTNSPAPSPTSATYKTAPSATKKPHATSPSRNSPKTSSTASTTSTERSQPSPSPTAPTRTSSTCTTG